MMISSERLLGLILLATGGFALYVARDYTFWAAVMPRAISGALLVLGLMLLIQSLKAPRLSRGQGDPLAVIVIIAVIVAYVWLLPKLGFIVSSILMFAAIGFSLGSRSRPVRALGLALGFALVVTAIMYFIFDYVLLVPLPRSSIF